MDPLLLLRSLIMRDVAVGIVSYRIDVAERPAEEARRRRVGQQKGADESGSLCSGKDVALAWFGGTQRRCWKLTDGALSRCENLEAGRGIEAPRIQTLEQDCGRAGSNKVEFQTQRSATQRNATRVGLGGRRDRKKWACCQRRAGVDRPQDGVQCSVPMTPTAGRMVAAEQDRTGPDRTEPCTAEKVKKEGLDLGSGSCTPAYRTGRGRAGRFRLGTNGPSRTSWENTLVPAI